MAIAPVPDEPVELVSIQMVGQGLRTGGGVPERVKPSRAELAPPPPRLAYFGPKRQRQRGGMDRDAILRRSISRRHARGR